MCVYVCVCSPAEQEELKRLLSSAVEEHEGVAVKLSSQLQSTRAELDRARGSLRALEGADGHGQPPHTSKKHPAEGRIPFV